MSYKYFPDLTNGEDIVDVTQIEQGFNSVESDINEQYQLLNNKANKNEIPIKISQLENDSMYATQELVTEQINKVSSDINEIMANKADKTELPKKTSELENDSNFAIVSDIPTKVSELTNDSDFITKSEVDTIEQSINSNLQALEEIKADKIINTASGTGIVLCDSASSNFKDIQITAETSTEVNVNIYGKNLFKFISPSMANGTVIETFENGAVVQGKQQAETTPPGSYSRGWLRSGQSSSTAICPRLFEGQTVTISADITLIEIGNSPNPYMMGILLSARAGGSYTDKTVSLNQTIGLKQKASATYTITSAYSGQIFYPVFSINSNTTKIENIQIEISDAATGYEEYKNQSINLTLPLTDEQKEEFKTLQTYKPVTTILNDKNIEITVDYEVDTKAYIDNKFNELKNAIIEIGGNE